MSKSISARSSRKRFAAKLQQPAKTNNNARALPAKLQIREHVLAAAGGTEAVVFDAFAGAGELYRGVWHKAGRYVGCDLDWYRDERLVYVADSRRVMRAIDLEAFNVFDFDAWGSPWEHVVILCARRSVKPGERLGLVLTEGTRLKLKFGGLPDALAGLIGFRRSSGLAGLGRARAYAGILDQAIATAAARLHCTVLNRWEAHGKMGSQMSYIGLVLEGIGAAPVTADTRAPADPPAIPRGRRRRSDGSSAADRGRRQPSPAAS
jgi:hypothetical protein